MDDAMTKNDFLQPLLDLMQRNAQDQSKRMDEFDSKLTANTKLTQKALDELQTNHATLQEHTRAIKALERKKGKKLDISPNVLYLVALASVILLLIIATILHVDLGRIFK